MTKKFFTAVLLVAFVFTNLGMLGLNVAQDVWASAEVQVEAETAVETAVSTDTDITDEPSEEGVAEDQAIAAEENTDEEVVAQEEPGELSVPQDSDPSVEAAESKSESSASAEGGIETEAAVETAGAADEDVTAESAEEANADEEVATQEEPGELSVPQESDLSAEAAESKSDSPASAESGIDMEIDSEPEADVEAKAEEEVSSQDVTAPDNSEQMRSMSAEPEQSADTQSEEPLIEQMYAPLAELCALPLTASRALENYVEKTVSTFAELKAAITEAGAVKTLIKVMQSFDLEEALTIGKDQNIILTANNTKQAEEWEPVKQAADYAAEGEAKQREIIDEARARGEAAVEAADLSNNPLPSTTKGDIILKRLQSFTNNSLFIVQGILSLGTEDTALYLDGNKDIKTAVSRGVVFDVSGELNMNNATVMNVNNGHGYTAAIQVNAGGCFNLNDGRISNNQSYETIDPYYYRPSSAGGVYVNPGGTFNMYNGLIDNNTGAAGGVFAGDLYGSNKAPATVNLYGGIIASNAAVTPFALGGGLSGYPKSEINLYDGIIANNTSRGPGGGISITDQFIYEYNNNPYNKWAKVGSDYEKHLVENKAASTLSGGLLYGNQANIGGGMYIDTNHVNFDKTMILDNKASNFGGGIYVSFPPRVQELENLLVTENKAKATWTDAWGGGDGGGLWNCPSGYVHISDGHSVYIYDNEAEGNGTDLSFSKKTTRFQLKEGSSPWQNIAGKFYSHVSPVTRGFQERATVDLIKFLEDGGSDQAIPEQMSYTQNDINLLALYSEQLKQEAWANAQTFFLGNTARLGGGIGSNANLVTPGDEGDYKLGIEKIWDKAVPENKRREVLVDIFIVPLDTSAADLVNNYGTDPRLFKYGEITLNAENEWTSLFHESKFAKFADLPAHFADNGLPYTADELAAKGYKYLVREQGDDFYVEVEEFKELTKAEVTIERKWLENHKYSDYDGHHIMLDQYLEIVYQNEAGVELNRKNLRLDAQYDDWKGLLPLEVLGEDIKVENVSISYYGYDTPYIWQGFFGLDNYASMEEDAHLIYVTRKNNGDVEIQLPYLWIQGYAPYRSNDYATNEIGYRLSNLNKKISGHFFKLTNYLFEEIPLEKKWAEQVKAEDMPESLTFYLTKDGERYVDEYGRDRSITLSAANGWQGVFEKLPPFFLEGTNYWVVEDSDKFAPKIEKFEDSELTKVLRFLLTNFYGPTHELELIKEWIGGEHQRPSEITLIVTTQEGEQKEIKLNEGNGWRETLADLEGTLRQNGYTVKEVKVEKFTSTSLAKKYLLATSGEESKTLSLELLDEALASKNYRYELITVEEVAEGKSLFDYITVVKNADGSYTIQYPEQISLKERLLVTVSNTYEDPEDPKNPPPEEPELPPEEPELPPSVPPQEPPVRRISEEPNPGRTTATSKAYVQKMVRPPVVSKALIENLPATSSAQAALEAKRGEQ